MQEVNNATAIGKMSRGALIEDGRWVACRAMWGTAHGASIISRAEGINRLENRKLETFNVGGYQIWRHPTAFWHFMSPFTKHEFPVFIVNSKTRPKLENRRLLEAF